MNKVTVTKAEMEAIKRQRDKHHERLNELLMFKQKNDFETGISRQLNFMSIEQIVLAWHGHAEVELEYVGFDEALKAFEDKKKIMLHYPNGKKDWFSHVLDWQQREVSPSFHEMVNGKWTIEGDNQ